MTKELINRSLPVVVSEIEQVLERYPEHPYQQAFANPDFAPRVGCLCVKSCAK